MSKKPSPIIKAKWDETVIPERPARKCDHYFEYDQDGIALCKNCNLGLYGVLQLKDGKPVL